MTNEPVLQMIEDQISDCYNVLWQDIGGLEEATESDLESFLGDLAKLITTLEKNPEAAALVLGNEMWETDLSNLKYHAIQIRKVIPMMSFVHQKLGEIDEPLLEHLRGMDEIEFRKIKQEEEMCGLCMNTTCTCKGNGNSENFPHVGGII